MSDFVIKKLNMLSSPKALQKLEIKKRLVLAI